MPKDIDHQELLRIDGELERLSRNLVCSQDDADDARQDAWMSATKGAASETPSLLGWLSHALRFRGMRKRRDETRRRDIESRSATQRATESAEDILERSEVRMRLVKAVSTLKPPYRQTITLVFFEGLANDDVARVMGVPQETVRTRTRRGLEQLRQQLDSEYGSRNTWALALVPTAVFIKSTTTSTVISEFIKGAAVMSGKVKVAIAAGFVLVVAVTIYQFTNENADFDLDSNQEASQGVAEAKVPRRNVDEDEKAVAEKAKPVATSEETKAKEEVTDIPRNQFGEEVGRLELTVTYGEGGEPAADIPVSFLPFSVTDPFFRKETFRTDQTGVLILPAYSAGTALITTRVGGRARLKIPAGTTTKHTLVVPMGSRITGRVLTLEDKPVVGAEIVSGDFGHPIQTEPITVTGADGRFVVPNFGHDTIGVLGARAKGFLPSALVMIFPSVGAEKKLDLILGGPAARAVLEVVDFEGEPVAGARCIAGKFDFYQSSLPDGNKGMKFSRTDDKTDENGRLALENLAPGDLEFVIRSYGFAAHKETIQVKEGQTVRHRVILQKGGIVVGVVTGADGLALERVQVNLGRYGDLASHFMRTNAKGEFRFENVVLGKASLTAEKKDCGEAKGSVVVTAAEPSVWNTQLKKPEGSVQGIVLDEGDNPVEGMSVSVMAFTSERYIGGFDKSDKNGRFKVTGLEAGLSGYTLSVSSPKNSITLRSIPGVASGPDIIRVVIPNDAIGVATIIGRIVGKDGRAVSGATISAMRQPFVSGGGTGIKTADGEGRFEFKDISPGRYRFLMRAPLYGSQKSEEKVVLNGQTLDVGDLAFIDPGRVKINTPGLGAGDKTTIYARSLDDGSSINIQAIGPTSLSQPLAPGHYRLKLGGQELVTRTKDVTLTPGQTVEVTLPVSQGRAMKFSFAKDLKDGSMTSYSYKLSDAGGVVIAEGTRKKYRTNTLYLTFTMGQGNHTLEVEGGDGRTGRLLLTAESQAEQVLRLN
ncbi:MAG: RNA polymerase sigma-70 factor (ECF subfamily) [Planctomycetota bacterium]|jgi:RNA polymerase sigma-70 factor (ECF subfamily)